MTTAPARAKHPPPRYEPSRVTLSRLGRNEALARQSGRDREPRQANDSLPFQCECEGERCRETLMLTQSDYAHVRAQRGWFLVAPGHQIRGARIQVRLNGCFVLQRET